MKLIYNFTWIIACMAIIACSKNKDKNTLPTIQELTVADSGGTASVTMGETFALTVGNPGDGGYVFNDPKYDTLVLTLVSHDKNVGVHPGLIGDFGKDIWKFTAKASGTTGLKIIAIRGGTRGADTLSMFANQIVVK